MNDMAKESKHTTVTAEFTYDGISMTLTKVVYDYEIEDGVKDLATQVKMLAKGGALDIGMGE